MITVKVCLLVCPGALLHKGRRGDFWAGGNSAGPRSCSRISLRDYTWRFSCMGPFLGCSNLWSLGEHRFCGKKRGPRKAIQSQTR
ncbi:hypothetical protein L873DRAFT_330939 [Choiromyces venosus 120613-1]|uniref:Uncharacterized protein n=1 Tax=Choiromyces venosus 120613-1 TaxID=1336337 RepID=A0A3N4K3I8_9PEZI|nr:hypothetical protein L873DRAFT_330939 [Choiromyces venosus 120613-1]